MHWVMWIFWGSMITLIVGSYLVDFLTGRKYNLKEQEKSLNQNSADADSLREMARHDQQNGPF
ncbi:hypothetical protein [Sporosarcina sp. JAI121]|uniref:hypothetical protein n=1 Tax=Sporosarcina sp. JAI121 TaxID=2723064 RepID=UPI0015CAFB96|nr:hypothetical protein [Sporosarcina sp. JAI121]NYF25413.1 hypothetical protein [Sporosarcina sp. JAI121]